MPNLPSLLALQHINMTLSVNIHLAGAISVRSYVCDSLDSDPATSSIGSATAAASGA
jgi:hypothetical protein